MKCSSGNEQNMIGAHHSVSRVHRRTFDNRQDVALHAFARNVGAVAGFSTGNFVDLVEKDDPGRFDPFERSTRDGVHIDQAFFFFLH